MSRPQTFSQLILECWIWNGPYFFFVATVFAEQKNLIFGKKKKKSFFSFVFCIYDIDQWQYFSK